MTGLDNLFIFLSSLHKIEKGRIRLVGFQRFLGPLHFRFTFYFVNIQSRPLTTAPSTWHEYDSETLSVLGVVIIG